MEKKGVNNCKNPLKLKYLNSRYVVNKTGFQDGEYVEKEVAMRFLFGLISIKRFMVTSGLFCLLRGKDRQMLGEWFDFLIEMSGYTRKRVEDLRMSKGGGEVKVDLVEKYKDGDIKERFKRFKEKNEVGEVNEKLRLRAGAVVEFDGGYDLDAVFKTEVLGFNHDGTAFVLWDCFWFSVDLKERNYKVLYDGGF